MSATRKPIELRSLLCGFLLAYAVIITLVAPALRRANRPPLDVEFKEIAAQTYRYFDAHGSMPSDLMYLPEHLRRLVGGPGSGIEWHAAELKFTYTYPKPYPMNPTVLGLLTFGRFSGSSPMELGASITEEMVRHNTPLYKAAGKLSKTDDKPKTANKTDAGNGSYGICRVIDASRSPSLDP